MSDFNFGDNVPASGTSFGFGQSAEFRQQFEDPGFSFSQNFMQQQQPAGGQSAVFADFQNSPDKFDEQFPADGSHVTAAADPALLPDSDFRPPTDSPPLSLNDRSLNDRSLNDRSPQPLSRPVQPDVSRQQRQPLTGPTDPLIGQQTFSNGPAQMGHGSDNRSGAFLSGHQNQSRQPHQQQQQRQSGPVPQRPAAGSREPAASRWSESLPAARNSKYMLITCTCN
jgi:hypothetical protein